METFIINKLNISPDVFTYVVLPIMIFVARVLDVSLATLRVMYIMNGARKWAPLLGFFEALIWLLAIGQIIQNISSPLSYISYAGGYAAGTYLGMLLESRIAMGRMVVRIITRTDISELINWLIGKGYRYNAVDSTDHEGNASLIFTVVPRSKLEECLEAVKFFQPDGYYTVEGIKRLSDDDLAIRKPRKSFVRYLPLVRK